MTAKPSSAPPGKVWIADLFHPEEWNLVDQQAVDDPENYVNPAKGETPLNMTMCMFCEHFRSTDGAERCAAFDGEPIPQEILDMNFDHRWPHPEDNGLRFEPTEDAPEELKQSPLI